MALISVDGLHVGYGDAEILHGVGLELKEPSIVTIIGPNGAGKSTLLKAIMGFLKPKKGRIGFAGADITALRPDERVARGIAYVPQLENVFPSLTVEENLRMGGFIVPRAEVWPRMDALYEQFPRLAQRRKQRVGTMSGGERQMLALARALMTDPKLLLLDEPSAALSPQMAGEVFDTVVDIYKQGRGIIIVEQEAHRSLEISHRGYVLANGQNAFEGPADSILSDEKIREAYLGTTR